MSNVTFLSPTPASSAIPEDEVSSNRLASILTSAVIENEIDHEGDIYASDGLEFPMWISIDVERKLLCFFTYLIVEDADTGPKLCPDAVNNLNATLAVVQFTAKNGRLWGHYWMTFDTALNPRQFVKMIRRFVGAFRVGIEQLRKCN